MPNHPHLTRPATLSNDVRRRRLWLLIGAAALAAALVGSAARPIGAGAAKESDHQVSGAGRTVIEGGAPGLVPVTTVLAFHASGQGGDFEVNAMYVTGKVTSVTARDGTLVLHGTATVTCIGAGANLPFTFIAQAGGPGTTATLTVSGLTFYEILLEGQITVH